MSERVIMIVVQPCILCEQDQEVWTLWKDEEQAGERWTIEALEHFCEGSWYLIQERFGRLS